jgi:hypothetical protein
MRLKKRYPHLNIFHADYKIHYRHFIEILRDSKIFISPFGLGEFSGKDYEAMLSGALLVRASKLAITHTLEGNAAVDT